ncbi:hypothetical protein BSKO_07581 [Bryopsis sp. KO-2023]|nr:hypothetical protein BSKO_07581 [Bryopsis sp. KO-2023]
MSGFTSAFLRGLRSAAKRASSLEAQTSSARLHTLSDAIPQFRAPASAAAAKLAGGATGPLSLLSFGRASLGSLGQLRSAHRSSVGGVMPPSSQADESEFDMKHNQMSFEDVEVGKVYEGRVVNLANFGCFVNFGCEMDCLVHISQMSDSFVRDVADVVSVGTEVRVKILNKDDDRRRISGSFKSTDMESRGSYY